jgi:hypothetical protein
VFPLAVEVLEQHLSLRTLVTHADVFPSLPTRT